MTIQFNREWKAIQKSDLTVDSSNKVFTVPPRKEWLIQSIRAAYATNATAGTRQLEVRYADESANIVAETLAGQTQAASLNRTYNHWINGLDAIAWRDTSYLTVVLPHLILPPSYTVRVLDNKAVDPTGSGENLIIRMLILERDI